MTPTRTAFFQPHRSAVRGPYKVKIGGPPAMWPADFPNYNETRNQGSCHDLMDSSAAQLIWWLHGPLVDGALRSKGPQNFQSITQENLDLDASHFKKFIIRTIVLKTKLDRESVGAWGSQVEVANFGMIQKYGMKKIMPRIAFRAT